MRKIAVVLTVFLITATACSHVGSRDSNEPEEYSSQRIELALREYEILDTIKLREYVCDGVRIDRLRMERKPRSNGDLEITLEVTALAQAGEKKSASLKFEFINDESRILFHKKWRWHYETSLADHPDEWQYGALLVPGVLVKPGERTTRRIVFELSSKDVEFFTGPNPRLAITMDVGSAEHSSGVPRPGLTGSHPGQR